MKRGTRKRITAALLAGGLLWPTAGCGDMFTDAVKGGIVNWVTTSLNASLVANQLMQLIEDAINRDGAATVNG